MSQKYRVDLTDPALADIEDILRYTLDKYGRKMAQDYDRLIRQALRDLGQNPMRPGSKARPEIHEAIRSYHISLSKTRAHSPIKSPRHLVLYFEASKDSSVVISRILHDTRDLSRHLPDQHKQTMDQGIASTWAKRDRGGRER